MKLIVDRIEEKIVILENEKGELFSVSATMLPPIKAGDVLTIAVDQNETEKRKNKIGNLLDELFTD